MKTSARLAGMAVSVLAIATANPVFAQDAGEQIASASDLTEIFVTASRREERAIDVPVAVTAISGEALDVINSSGLDIRFLSARTPSLNVESSFGRTFPRFYIRGLGNTDFDPNAAQPVSVVYDDVALENPMLKSFPVFDVESVQVLRGPQGTLFGRNTPAGVVKIDSAKPTDYFTGKFSASYGNLDTINLEGAIGGPITDVVSFRVSGLMQRRDDWVKNLNTTGLAEEEFEGYEDIATRAQLLIEDDGNSLLLNAHYRHLDASPRIFRAGAILPGSNDANVGFDPKEASLDGYTGQTMEQWGGSFRASLGLGGDSTLSLIAGYEEANVTSTGDIDGGDCYAFIPGCNFYDIHVAAFPVNTGGNTKPSEMSTEVRFDTGDLGGYRMQVGAYYFDQELSYREFAFDGTTIVSDVYHRNDNRNFGVFAGGEVSATDRLTLRAGVRYSDDKKTDRITGTAQLPAVTLPVTNTAKGDNISWDVSATYEVSPDTNVYARVATGYQGPAIQDRVNFFSIPNVAKEQTTISGEAGIKSALMGRTLRLDLAGYWWRTDDLQLTAVGGEFNSARLINADHAIGYGLEGELIAKPTPYLDLTLGGSWNFTEIRDNDLFIAPCGGGCTVIDPLNDDGLAIIDGNDLPQAPRYVANATLRYGVPVGAGEVYFFTDWAYRSATNFFLYEAVEFRGKELLEGGVRAGYAADAGWEVAGFVRNVTDEIVFVSGIDFNNLTGMINEPRTYGVELRYSF
ncbi:TonB-dependent receptor [Croceicoccus ponticola]|uniref:TonB-dependent receptor n=2 Tax=Croceicoccus ponticola TaxID=2217664 RepID=A0A437H169_9SPHN|nr:TonB-dependent receptor [Croceicoccus ponticola]